MTQLEPRASNYLAAGLVVCGMYFLKSGERHQAIDAFRKAEVAARGSARILQKILVELSTQGLEAEMKGMLDRLPAEIKDSPAVRLAELQYLNRSGASAQVLLALGNSLLQSGIEDENLFRIILTRSVETGRKASRIAEGSARRV